MSYRRGAQFFSRSSIKYLGHTGWKSMIWIQFEWDHWAGCSYQIPQICLVQGHLSSFKVTQLKKIVDFHPKWAIPDCNSSLKSPMALKWCTKLYIVKKRCPIVVLQGHLSNFKVTWNKKVADCDRNWAFRDCNCSLNSPMALKPRTKLDIV